MFWGFAIENCTRLWLLVLQLPLEKPLFLSMPFVDKRLGEKKGLKDE